MSRGRKLMFAGLVLIVGFALAWPFRKTAADKALDSAAAPPHVDVSRSQQVTIQQPTRGLQEQHDQHQATMRGKRAALDQFVGQRGQMPAPAPQVVAKTTSLGKAGAVSTAVRSTASFDLANHPALAGPASLQSSSPVTPPVPSSNQAPLKGYLPAQMQSDLATARPAYATTNRGLRFDAEEQRLSDVRHVVQNSDTLEKLAKRYLGDEGRALEIFDLNRDVLDNPHLLPIDAQLRIPGRLSIDAKNR